MTRTITDLIFNRIYSQTYEQNYCGGGSIFCSSVQRGSHKTLHNRFDNVYEQKQYPTPPLSAYDS